VACPFAAFLLFCFSAFLTEGRSTVAVHLWAYRGLLARVLSEHCALTAVTPFRLRAATPSSSWLGTGRSASMARRLLALCDGRSQSPLTPFAGLRSRKAFEKGVRGRTWGQGVSQPSSPAAQ